MCLPEDEKCLVLRSERIEHNSSLVAAAKDACALQIKDYAIIQNHGYKGLYDGVKAMSKRVLSIDAGRRSLNCRQARFSVDYV